MAKVTLQRVTTFQNDVSAPAAFNANMALLEEIIDTLLSRDGAAPNTLEADVDMNGKRIYNLPDAQSLTEPVTQSQLNELVLSNTEGSITNGSVDTDALATEAVTTGKIANGAVTVDKLAADSVTSAKIVNGTIVNADIADSTINVAKLAAIAASSVIANNTAGSAVPTEVSFSDLSTALSAYGVSAIPVGAVIPYAVAAAPTGYLVCDGSAVSRTTYSALYAVLCPSSTVTFDTSGNTATWTGHTLKNTDRIYFSTTGSLPTGLTAGTAYYVINVSGDTFQISSTAGGSAIDLDGTPSGTNTCQLSNYGLGNGTTTFNVPDYRGEFLRGLDLGAGVDSNRSLSASQDHQLQTHIHTVSNVWIYSSGVSGYAFPSTLAAGTATTSAPTSGNIGSETRPRNKAVNYIIKY